MRKTLTAATLAVALPLSLAACGDDGDDEASSSATTTVSTSAPDDTSTSAPSTAPGSTAPGGSTTPTTNADSDGGLDLDDGRHPAYLTSVDVAGRTLTFDVIQFLTGSEATTAYQAETGETDTPPNDYFIVNENPKLRTAPVSSGVTVQLVRLADDSDADLDPGTWDELPAYLAQPGIQEFSPFWLTVSGGEVTAIEEQFLP